MKPCHDRWREELIEHAAGAQPSAALAGHLKTCAACSEALRAWQAQMTQIATGIRQLARSEPPSGAAQQILTRARSQTTRFVPWKWAAASLAGVTVAVGLFFYGWRIQEQRQETEKALSAASAIGRWKSPTAELLYFSSGRWMKTPPQFGHYFYPLSAGSLEKEMEKP